MHVLQNCTENTPKKSPFFERFRKLFSNSLKHKEIKLRFFLVGLLERFTFATSNKQNNKAMKTTTKTIKNVAILEAQRLLMLTRQRGWNVSYFDAYSFTATLNGSVMLGYNQDTKILVIDKQLYKDNK